MAREFRHPPSAACLSASMRDLGYSLETAVADLIDNSISARATRIDVVCDMAADRPFVAILDNGDGMDEEMLLAAMRHGSAHPDAERSARDLGRFGLGLKTASFSQCRSLTVVSKPDHGKCCGTEWNLDRIHKTDDWTLAVLNDYDMQRLPCMDRLGSQGTIVIWQALDRLTEDETGHRSNEIVNEKLDLLGKHLALVFHRFLSTDPKAGSRIAITINGHPIDAFDPFCRRNPATQMLPEETLRIGNGEVRIQPWILPHHSKLSASEYDFYLDRSDFISNQGAYVYRNGRLMAWGDWFRLIPKGEATKLARVQIDFPSCMDELWTIDIKKSRARPPVQVRDRLRQIIERISGSSRTVHRGHGQRLFREAEAPVWERYAERVGIRYALNGEHPLVQRVMQNMTTEDRKALSLLLEAISSSLPVEMIYADYSGDPRSVAQVPSEQDVREKLQALREALPEIADARAFREIVVSTRLFEKDRKAEEIIDTFIKEEFA
jgi:hypothetical protein